MSIKLEKGFSFWAKGNVFMLRLAKYVQLLNLAMIARLFVRSFDSPTTGVLVLLGCSALLAVISFIDYMFVLGKEVGAIFEKNTEWIELRKDIDEIKKELKRERLERHRRKI